MSKRRKKGNKPNIPQATLDRAREQAGLPVEQQSEEVVEKAAKPKAETTISPKNKSAARATSNRRSSRNVSAGQLDLRKRRGELDVATVEAALEHPTKFPTEEELHAQYGFVLRDLRNMFLLAGVLLVLLVIIATVL